MLATNASTLSIDRIAGATSRPGDVVGLHFFNPANVMRLLEIVRGPRASHATVATSLALAKTLGKVGVVVGDGPGFVGNRMMLPYMYEANYLVEEGATPEQVDRALTGFGMAMGMFAVDDMGGLDVAISAQRALGHFSDPGERRPLVQPKLVEMGRLGQKTWPGLVRLRRRSQGEARSGSRGVDSAGGARGRHPAADVLERGHRRAAGLHADQ